MCNLVVNISAHNGDGLPFQMKVWCTIPKVGNRPVNMSIDQTSGHYWL